MNFQTSFLFNLDVENFVVKCVRPVLKRCHNCKSCCIYACHSAVLDAAVVKGEDLAINCYFMVV